MAAASSYFSSMDSTSDAMILWLDKNINEDCQYTILQLQHIGIRVELFTDEDECVDFLTNVEKGNVIMVISSALSYIIIPLIYDITRLRSMFVHTSDGIKHEFPSKWKKVKRTFADASVLGDAIEEAVQHYGKNDVPISFISANDSISAQTLNQLNQSFMYTQILKEIFLKIDFGDNHVREFADYYRRHSNNENHRSNRIDFEEYYRQNTPIRLYTRDVVMYSPLNRALREVDVDFIMKISFFLCHLHHHIAEEHENQSEADRFGRSFWVYRGQNLSRQDFDRMRKTKGGLLSFNNFLSTSYDRNVALIYAETDSNNPDLVGILFVMTIDPSRSTTPFANIRQFTQFQDEDEILFCMHTIFRIGEIQQINAENRLWQVNLTLTNDDDRDLRRLTNRIREETHPEVDGWQRLALVLQMMGEPQKAEQIYTVLMKERKNERKEAVLYHQLGETSESQKNYGMAITLHEESRRYMERNLPPNHPDLVACYNDLGNAYQGANEHEIAISYYHKAIKIQLQICCVNDPNLASLYNNIASTYYLQGDNSNALQFYENALEIQTEILPLNHPHLAVANDNIGLVYHSMGKCERALAFHEIALEMRRKTLPPNHPDLITSYRNIASVYASMGNRSKANEYNRKADDI